jgi:hypothetical protein
MAKYRHSRRSSSTLKCNHGRLIADLVAEFRNEREDRSAAPRCYS